MEDICTPTWVYVSGAIILLMCVVAGYLLQGRYSVASSTSISNVCSLIICFLLLSYVCSISETATWGLAAVLLICACFGCMSVTYNTVKKFM